MENLGRNAGILLEYGLSIYAAYSPIVWVVLLGYWLIISYAAYLMFKLDKALAIGGLYRVSEAALLGLAFWGGSIGAKIAQRRFRHKTRKEPFRSTLNLICVLHIGVVLAGNIGALGYWPTILRWLA